jgi:xanthine dehydrogenase small subunit
MIKPKRENSMTDGNSIRFLMNDELVVLDEIQPTYTLLDFLRLKRRLTGTKEGCAEGDCGACTVLVGRLIGDKLAYESVNACIRFVASLHGTHVVTVEHLAAKDGTLHPVQQAMVDFHGSQCGFCTPGFVMSLYGLWLSTETPDREAIEKALQGNLCRCTGYEPIVKAAEHVSRARPDALFDPLEKTRQTVTAQLQALALQETITMETDEGRLFIPATTADLAEILLEEPNATIVAGSTDVGLWVTKHMRRLDPVVFINHLSELQSIDVSDVGIEIGAGVTYAQAFEALTGVFPDLAPLVNRIGGAQVRNMGTIGGNIANGSPIGDMPPALIALGSVINLQSTVGHRKLMLEEYYIEYGKQNRSKTEFVEHIFVPRLNHDERFAVYKISKRRDEDISALCGAFRIQLDDNNIVKAITIAFGGMAGTPKRAHHVENALRERPWTQASVDMALSAFEEDYQPLTDWRATAQYRMLTAKNLLTRFYLETQGSTVQLQRFERQEALA